MSPNAHPAVRVQQDVPKFCHQGFRVKRCGCCEVALGRVRKGHGVVGAQGGHGEPDSLDRLSPAQLGEHLPPGVLVLAQIGRQARLQNGADERQERVVEGRPSTPLAVAGMHLCQQDVHRAARAFCVPTPGSR